MKKGIILKSKSIYIFFCRWGGADGGEAEGNMFRGQD